MSNYSKDQSPFQHLWTEGYEFRMGSYIRGGFNLLKAYPFGYLGHVLISLLATIIVSLLVTVVGMATLSSLSIVGVVVNQALGFFISAFAISLFAGIYFVGNEYRKDNRRSFDGFFQGFNHFGQIFLYSLSVGLFFFLISLAAMKVVNFDLSMLNIEQFLNPDFDIEELPYIMSDFVASLGPDFYQKVAAFGGLVTLLTVYFRVAWSFTIPLIVLKNIRFWEAMEVSRKIVTRKWFHFFGFYIFMGVLIFLAIGLFAGISGFLISALNFGFLKGIVGLILFIGIFSIIPYIYLTQYAAFDDIVLEDEGGMEGMINDIGSEDGPEDTF